MKILILSFYFRPDLSAGSFRATTLVETLCNLVPPDSQIDVITTLPNRYHSFSADALRIERLTGLCITRIALPRHRGGMLDQSRAFLTYFLGALVQVRKRDYDLVFVTSGRLMSTVLGAFISRWKSAKLYLDIRDIFVDTIKDVLPRRVSWFMLPALSILERWAVDRADKVNLVSEGFAEYFSVRYPRQRFTYFTNGIDREFISAAPTLSPTPTSSPLNRPITVVYAGNLGDGQGLHAIVPALAKAMGARVRFRIIGDGGRKTLLASTLKKHGVTNVELILPVKRSELLEAYRAADVLFLHLNDYDAFKKVLPSKLFEYAALGKPIWAGVAGYAARFAVAEISNAAVFYPCDVASAVHAFSTLKIQDTPRNAFVEKYARSKINGEMGADILSVARGE